MCMDVVLYFVSDSKMYWRLVFRLDSRVFTSMLLVEDRQHFHDAAVRAFADVLKPWKKLEEQNKNKLASSEQKEGKFRRDPNIRPTPSLIPTLFFVLLRRFSLAMLGGLPFPGEALDAGQELDDTLPDRLRTALADVLHEK
eukprot:GHVT01039584.1.p1 GENE.GHVT01039584.1~~GHVT01039584.1.p1  ORF type:complete len:141 (+),score=12.05 GHVT01039584.1:1820-2242(+)